MIQVNAMGDACPIPVVKTMNALKELKGPGQVETLVDNEVAVQNLTRLANQRGCGVKSEKLGDKQFKVTLTVGGGAQPMEETAEEFTCSVPAENRKKVVAVIASDKMGEGSDELGKVLMKGFLYALSQQETLPATILFYNGGAKMTCENSPALEDLKSMEAQGVEILTCGTCLNHYGLGEQLKVGQVTNMYVIAEKMTQADLIVKP